MKKRIKYILPIFICVITFVAIKEYYYSRKYEATKLNIKISDLKNNWGKPDYEFVPKKENDCRVIKYENYFGQYVFLSDAKDSLIVHKAIDD